MKHVIRKNKKTEHGIATLEMLIALAIIVITISAVILVVFGSQSAFIGSQTNQEALYKAQQAIENARATARADFNDPTLNAGTTTTYDDSEITYTKNLAISNTDDFTKKITSQVTWGNGSRVQLSTLITNLQAGTTCNLALSGDWKNPQHYDYPSPDLMPINNSNGISISDLKVYGRKLYVAAKTTANTDDTFYIFDLQNDPSQAPAYHGSIDNASTVSIGLNALAVSGKYAYVANAYGANFNNCSQGNNCAQMQIIDISNPSILSVVKNLKIPGVTGSGGQAIGKSIFYSKGYVYLGLAKTESGPELNIIDVGGGGALASPTNPIWKGGYSVGNAVNAIYVKDNYAYIATPNSENLTIIDVDVNSVAFAQRLGGYTPTGLNNGKSVYMISNTVYLGRTYGSNEFYILDAPTPTSISVSGSKDNGTGNLTSINGLIVRDYLAFFITNSQFQTWNISDPGSITPWTSDGTANTFLSFSDFTNGAGTGTGTALYCSGNYFYIALTSPQGNNKDIISIIGPGVTKTTPTITTTIYNNADGQPVTSVPSGTTIYDRAVVSGNTGTPTGTVDFILYTNKSDCSAVSQTENKSLVSGVAQSSTYTTSNKSISYKVHYHGDANYNAVDSACESLTVN